MPHGFNYGDRVLFVGGPDDKAEERWSFLSVDQKDNLATVVKPEEIARPLGDEKEWLYVKWDNDKSSTSNRRNGGFTPSEFIRVIEVKDDEPAAPDEADNSDEVLEVINDTALAMSVDLGIPYFAAYGALTRFVQELVKVTQ